MITAVWCAALALAAAGMAVTQPGAVRALLWLGAALLALSGSFYALDAGFAASLTILVYVGAIVVVFVFAVMTMDSSPEALAREREALRRSWRAPAAMMGLVALPFLVGLGGRAGPVAPDAVPVQAIGRLLFGPWALVIELASALLLAGLIGARHLGRRGGRR